MKRYEAVNIPFYYCDIPNFGDALNPVIFEKLAGIKIRLAPVDYALIMGIGSLGENLLMDNIPPPPPGVHPSDCFRPALALRRARKRFRLCLKY